MMNLYHQEIMDHYRYPRNRGAVAGATFSSQEYNPSCGDRVQFQGIVHKGAITHIGFTGHGCVISQSTASMLTELVLNKSIKDVLVLDKDAILTMLGITLGPTRLKCALLPLQALQEGLKNYA